MESCVRFCPRPVLAEIAAVPCSKLICRVPNIGRVVFIFHFRLIFIVSRIIDIF